MNHASERRIVLFRSSTFILWWREPAIGTPWHESASLPRHGLFYIGPRCRRGAPGSDSNDSTGNFSNRISKPSWNSAWNGRAEPGAVIFRSGRTHFGKPDLKEGLYFGAELGPDDASTGRRSLHGANLFPNNLPGFRETVLAYMAAMTQLGHALMEGIALSLGLEGLTSPTVIPPIR